MWVSLGSALLFLILVYFTIGESPRWDLMYQDTYEIEIHHIEVPWYNTSYGKVEHAEMVRFNRSLPRALNASGYLTKEIGRNLVIKAQLYKLLSNQYKFFPLTVTVQACQEYDKNSFGAKDIIDKYTNLNPCPQKPGHLIITRLYIDSSRLPPLIPYGDYKLALEVFLEKDKLTDLHIFGSVRAKPRT